MKNSLFTKEHRWKNWQFDSIFWSIILVWYLVYAMNLFKFPLWLAFINKVAFMPFQILAGSILIYYLIPKLLLKRKYLTFIFGFFLIAYILGAMIYLVDNFIIAPYIINDYQEKTVLEVLLNYEDIFGHYIVWVYTIPIGWTVVKLVYNHFEDRKKILQLEKEKATKELNGLKAQIHPKFLSSTLRHLHKLTLEKSDLAPEVIEKLSEILDYLIYQTQEDHVFLKQELEMLENYLAIEQIRHGTALNLDYQIQLDHSNALIPPALLLSIMEYLFRFPLEGTNPPFEVTLQINQSGATLNITAKKRPFTDAYSNIEDEALNKLKRQLNLACPNQNELNLEFQQDYQFLSLELSLQGALKESKANSSLSSLSQIP